MRTESARPYVERDVKRRALFVGYWLLAAVSLLVLAACGSDAASAGKPGVMEKQRAVDFTLETLDGQTVSLADYQGKVVLLNFWATWCPPCELEMPDLQKAYEKYEEQGLVVLAVNAGEPAPTVQAFVTKLGLTFPILMDARGQVGAQYRASGLPMSLVVDREGIIRARHLGYLSAGQLDKYLARVGLE